MSMLLVSSEVPFNWPRQAATGWGSIWPSHVHVAEPRSCSTGQRLVHGLGQGVMALRTECWHGCARVVLRMMGRAPTRLWIGLEVGALCMPGGVVLWPFQSLSDCLAAGSVGCIIWDRVGNQAAGKWQQQTRDTRMSEHACRGAPPPSAYFHTIQPSGICDVQDTHKDWPTAGTRHGLRKL